MLDSLLISSRDLAFSEREMIWKEELDKNLLDSTNISCSRFESEYQKRSNADMPSLLLKMEDQWSFKSDILNKVTTLQRFIGEDFPLSLEEKISILLGTSDFLVKIDVVDIVPKTCHETLSIADGTMQARFPGGNRFLEIDAEKLRIFGQEAYNFQLSTSLLFSNELHLSEPQEEINSNISMLRNDEVVIPLFMKQNLLYESLIDSRSLNRGGAYFAKEEYKKKKESLKKWASIQSFYMMLGVLMTKFPRQKVLNDLIQKKVINGRNGIVHISSQTSREF